MSHKPLLFALGLLQALFALRVARRLLRTTGGERVRPVLSLNAAEGQCLVVIVPVLNEYERLGPCLEGLLQQGGENVHEKNTA
ncbi:MAG TPA: glycosyltransferase family A protein [Ktedonobacteraceae bacterium]|nr:glycosyltransferase family A protein [Ktedonobacteraceae bacterium]